MTPEQQMEQFSYAYVRAVAAAARVNVYHPEVDTDSIDLGFSVKSVVGRPQPPKLEAQVKCTSKSVGRSKFIRYALKVKNYNELAGRHYVPRILILVVVPKSVRSWLTQDEKALALRRCGYWLSLAAEAETDNATSVTVKVPRSQMFSITALQGFLGTGGVR